MVTLLRRLFVIVLGVLLGGGFEHVGGTYGHTALLVDNPILADLRRLSFESILEVHNDRQEIIIKLTWISIMST